MPTTYKLTVTVPEREASGRQQKIQEHRRDWVKRDMLKVNQRLPNATVNAHVDPKDKGTFYVTVTSNDELDLTQIDNLLVHSVDNKRAFEITQRSIAPPTQSNTAHTNQDTQLLHQFQSLGTLDDITEQLSQLTRYQALGDVADLHKRINYAEEEALREAERRENAQAQVQSAHQTIRDLETTIFDTDAKVKGLELQLEQKGNLQNPNSLSLSDIAVLTARKLHGKEYLKNCDTYDNAFPNGVTEHLEKISMGRRDYVLSPQIIATIQSTLVGKIVDDSKRTLEDRLDEMSITQIIAELESYDNDFENSVHGKSLGYNYAAAKAIVWQHGNYSRIVSRNKGKRRISDKELAKLFVSEVDLQQAKQLIEVYEMARNDWSDIRSHTQRALREIYDRSEEYASYTKDIRMSVPMVTYNDDTSDTHESIYFVLPTTTDTDDRTLTTDILLHLAGAVRDVHQEADEPGDIELNDTNCLGTTVIEMKTPKGYAQKGAIFDSIIEHYRNSALAKIVDLDIHYIGGKYNDE